MNTRGQGQRLVVPVLQLFLEYNGLLLTTREHKEKNRTLTQTP